MRLQLVVPSASFHSEAHVAEPRSDESLHDRFDPRCSGSGWRLRRARVSSGGPLTPPCADPDRLILLKDQFALLEATAREIGDAGVAARLSLSAGINGLGAYGYLVASQPTLRAALLTARDMLPVMLQTATTVGLTIDGRWAQWSYEVDDSVVVGRRQNDLLCAGYVLDVFRRFGGPGWVPHRFTIAGAPIEGRAAIETLFGCTLSPGSKTALTFPADMLDCRNLAPLAPRKWDALPAEGDPIALVSRAIASGLGEDRPDLVRTARRLGLAPRTLQRRLQAHGTSFEQVLDSTLAEPRLRSARRPRRHADISDRDRLRPRLRRAFAFHARVQALDRSASLRLAPRKRWRPKVSGSPSSSYRSRGLSVDAHGRI